ncbi:hypothetical protein [Sulfurisphaera ohwakuensis]|uniref:hypothetical protein n=1 Tax=Sulfurisphaera ohwakuensis TaxID=69656 RepID=UPI0036F2377B
MELQQLLIPKVTVSKMRKKNGYIYYVYIPQSYTEYIQYKKWNIIAVLNGKEIPLGPRSPFKHGNNLIVTLPLAYKDLWESLLGREIDLIFLKI